MGPPAPSVKRGAAIFKAKCSQCHTSAQGAAHKQGPNLAGLFQGRVSGAAEGYRFSRASRDLLDLGFLPLYSTPLSEREKIVSM